MPHLTHRTNRARLAAAVASVTVLGAGLGLTPPAAADTASAPSAAEQGYVSSTLARMTLEQKVGQLFITYAYGEGADAVTPDEAKLNHDLYGVDTPAEVVRKYHLGGVIYFAWTDSVNEPHQIARLSNGLQRAATTAGDTVDPPLQIATDQEMGIVTRIGPPATQFPGNMALGAGRSADDAQTAARITGQELRAMGVNQDFAPDADVNVNPANPVIGVRSFGSRPDLVAQMVGAQVDGYQRPDGTSATAKHFPGHGDTATDSHTGLPVITHTRDEWEKIDAPPFREAIKHGIDAIMTAHIVVPNLDPSGDPATLSKPVLTGLLRGELGFKGVIVTDSLGMQGVREKYGDDRVPVLALKAGADQLLMPPDMDLAFGAVLDAVHSGEISESRIDQSVERVLRLKWERGIVAHPYVDVAAVDQVVGTPAHQDAARAITARTTTVVTNPGHQLPLPVKDKSVLVTGYAPGATAQTFADALTSAGAKVDVLTTGTNPGQAKIDQARAAAAAHDVTVVLTYNAGSYSGQPKLVSALAGTGKPVVAAGVRNPYDVNVLPESVPFLATYSWSGFTMQALADVITGAASPQGRLPVDIPSATDATQVLYPFGHGLTW